ncbi:MAG: hypothetical protein KF853_11710 [Rhodocyclaceae bacterium]|nr:hypothetical protein [Rhodocyclaceae bacterium]
MSVENPLIAMNIQATAVTKSERVVEVVSEPVEVMRRWRLYRDAYRSVMMGALCPLYPPRSNPPRFSAPYRSD